MSDLADWIKKQNAELRTLVRQLEGDRSKLLNQYVELTLERVYLKMPHWRNQ